MFAVYNTENTLEIWHRVTSTLIFITDVRWKITRRDRRIIEGFVTPFFFIKRQLRLCKTGTKHVILFSKRYALGKTDFIRFYLKLKEFLFFKQMFCLTLLIYAFVFLHLMCNFCKFNTFCFVYYLHITRSTVTFLQFL